MSISYCNMEDELQTFLIYRKICIFKIIDGKIWNASLICVRGAASPRLSRKLESYVQKWEGYFRRRGRLLHSRL